MGWFFFAVLAGVIYGAVELFDKFVFDHEVSRGSVSALLAKIPNFIVFATAGFFVQPGFDFSPVSFGIGVALAPLYLFSSYLYYVGIGLEDVSRFIPTLSVSSVFTVIISFVFLSERFTVGEYAGIMLTIAGAVLISMERPRRGIHIFQSKEALGLGFLAAFLWAVRDVVLKIGTSSIDIFQILFWIGINGLVLCLVTAVFLYSKLDGEELKGYEHLLMIGFLTSAGYLSFIKSLSLGPVSLASVIVKIDAALVFVGSIIITELHPEMIRESLEWHVLLQKAVALAMIVGGVAVIQLF